jgi:hypothetical protein
MANSHDEVHDNLLANLSDRVRTERGRLRRRISGEPEERPARTGPRIDLAPRIRAPRKGGRLHQLFRAWAEEPPPEA